MVRPALIALLVTTAAGAQSVINPARAARAERTLEAHEGGAPLRCDLTPLKPALNFGFRFQAGYVFHVPLNQYSGPGHGLIAITRITPEGGDAKPVYLSHRMALPAVPKTNMEAEVGGVYLLGEGRYSVKWLLLDDSGRVCRKEWRIDAKLGRSERSVKLAIPERTVADLSLRTLPARPRSPDDAAPFRLTVLLNAAPLAPRRTSMRAGDRVMLLATLASFLERVPARSVRLIVFNLEQQKILFRQDGFTPDEMDQVAQAINELQLGLVDYHVLQNRTGHLDLLAGMVNEELRAPEPSDAVVFLGPQARFADKISEDVLEKPHGTAPHFFYLQFMPFPRIAPSVAPPPLARQGPPLPPPPPVPGAGLAEPGMPDSISIAVAKLKGKTITLHTPGEFEKAIEQVERRTGGGS